MRREFPNLNPKIVPQSFDSLNRRRIFLDFNLEVSEAIFQQIQAEIDRLSVDNSRLLVFDALMSTKYPAGWLIQVLQLLDRKARIVSGYLVSLHGLFGAFTDMPGDDDEAQGSVEIVSTSTEILFSIPKRAIEDEYDYSGLFNILTSRLEEEANSLYRSGIIYVPLSQDDFLSKWSLVPVVTADPGSRLFQPNWTDFRFAGEPVPFLEKWRDGNRELELRLDLNPVRRHFLSLLLKDLDFLFRYRSPFGVSVILIQLDDSWDLQKVQNLVTRIYEVSFSSVGEVEFFNYANFEMARDSLTIPLRSDSLSTSLLPDSLAFGSVVSQPNTVIYRLDDPELPWIVSFLETTEKQPEAFGVEGDESNEEVEDGEVREEIFEWVGPPWAGSDRVKGEGVRGAGREVCVDRFRNGLFSFTGHADPEWILEKSYSPLIFGFPVGDQMIYDRTFLELALQSQVRNLIENSLGHPITEIQTRYQQGSVLFIPFWNGSRIYAPQAFLSQLLRKDFFDPEVYVLGSGPIAQMVARIITNPRLQISADDVRCPSKDRLLIQEFNDLYNGSLGSDLRSVAYPRSGQELISELAEMFHFTIRYRSELFALFTTSQPQINEEWILKSIQRIRANRLPLWKIDGDWFSVIGSEEGRAVFHAAVYFAFSRVILQETLLQNAADQIEIAGSAAYFPVVDIRSALLLDQALRNTAESEIFIKSVPDWESGLLLRLSNPDSLLFEINGEFWVASMESIRPPIANSEAVDMMIRRLTTCKDGKDPISGNRFDQMGLVELVQVLDDFEGGDRICYEAESWISLPKIPGASKFETGRNLMSLIQTGFYEGAAPGLIGIEEETVFPDRGMFEIAANFEQATVLLVDEDRQIPVVNLLIKEANEPTTKSQVREFERSETRLERSEVVNDGTNDRSAASVEDQLIDSLQVKWDAGQIFSSWGRALYAKLGRISNWPVFLSAYAFQARDSFEISDRLIRSVIDN